MVWAWAAIEADFQANYRIDLAAEVFGRRMSWRRFLVLVNRLPPNGNYGKWLRDRKNRRYVDTGLPGRSARDLDLSSVDVN